MKIDFCTLCGRIVLRDFSYCPYCGSSLRFGPPLSAALQRPFQKLERFEAAAKDKRIDQLLSELTDMEADMEALMEDAPHPD